MCIKCTPSAHDFLSHICLIITIGVLQKDEVWRLCNDNTAIGKNNTGRDVEFLRENGKLVCLTVTVCVFTNLDPVLTLTLHISYRIRIIDRFYNPQTTSFIPCHGNRFKDIGLSSKQFHSEINRNLGNQLRFSRAKCSLQFKTTFSFFVVRQFSICIFRIRFRHLIPVLSGSVIYGPENPVFQQFQEALIFPAALIVSVSRVKYLSLAIFFNPGIRLVMITFHSFSQHMDILSNLVVYISFIPGGKCRHTLHYRMFSIYNSSCKIAGAMRFKLSAHHIDVFRRILEAPGSAMYGYKTFAAFYIIQ